MLDAKLLRDDLSRIKERMAMRETEVDRDEWVVLDQQRNAPVSIESAQRSDACIADFEPIF